MIGGQWDPSSLLPSLAASGVGSTGGGFLLFATFFYRNRQNICAILKLRKYIALAPGQKESEMKTVKCKEVIRLLDKLSAEGKKRLIIYLRNLQDNADTSTPLSSSQAKVSK